MLQDFTKFIAENNLFDKTDKILLGVSGGIDSVVMLDLFVNSGYDCSIAHCNFNLRGEEAKEDEIFVKKLSEKYHINCFVKDFDTKEYAKKNNVSIQMAARELRYDWFEEIREKNEFKYVAVAHHADDSIETFFINLTRGTGIRGLTGILPKNNKIVRPLLCLYRSDIECYVKKYNLNFREDSSNSSTKYMRNNIRHIVIPALKKLNPSFNSTMYENMQRLFQIEEIYLQNVEENKEKFISKKEDIYIIDIEKLRSECKNEQIFSNYLHEILKKWQFGSDVVSNLIKEKESGKQFFSAKYRMVCNRNVLEISKIEQDEEKVENIEIKNTDKEIILSKKESLKINILDANETLEIQRNANFAYIDADKISFPLILRKWQKGDVFQPLGMKGKKKLSDFFTNQKMSLLEKERIWVLVSENKIVWIVGKRIDNRFKITNQTKNILLIEKIY